APPSGLKVAFPRDTLSEQTRLPVARLQPLLDLLARRNILRVRDAGGVPTWEMFHDAFIDIVRPWSSQHRAAQRRRRRQIALAAIGLLAVSVVVTNWGWSVHASRSAARLKQEKKLVASAAAKLEQEQFAERIRAAARRGDTKRAIARSLAAVTER